MELFKVAFMMAPLVFQKYNFPQFSMKRQQKLKVSKTFGNVHPTKQETI